MGQMVFVPMSRVQARALRDTGSSSGQLDGHAATPALLVAQDYDQSMLEDADYAALCFAGASALTGSTDTDVLRLVVAADLTPSLFEADEDSPYGMVRVRELPWPAVQALFSDEPGAAAAVAAARAAAAGRSVDAALTLAPVLEVFEKHDLLWFSPDELDQLPEM
jgi:hypothetical protein